MHIERFLHNNQFHIYEENKHILQSYNSKVVEIEILEDGGALVTLGKNWDYSNTTRRHVYKFLELYLPYGFSIDKLTRAKNKKAYIQKMIDNHELGYDKEMI